MRDILSSRAAESDGKSQKVRLQLRLQQISKSDSRLRLLSNKKIRLHRLRLPNSLYCFQTKKVRLQLQQIWKSDSWLRLLSPKKSNSTRPPTPQPCFPDWDIASTTPYSYPFSTIEKGIIIFCKPFYFNENITNINQIIIACCNNERISLKQNNDKSLL